MLREAHWGACDRDPEIKNKGHPSPSVPKYELSQRPEAVLSPLDLGSTCQDRVEITDTGLLEQDAVLH